ncbi:tetratricopeptide repeat protein [Spirochaeta isovalerica]|uniref:Tetratricopeptide (TPR) repeat protein n=1 Tax=Spirochaeta isovalerica TaxID=150 RepID=A0A841RCM8_9SPIO|nr:tetratricopeptide repeat protein [Spirochaeta isovalerica]MBB6481745.1 tetratricopeptide (TPR) repeat protein [Spirochaeta isovalerica]
MRLPAAILLLSAFLSSSLSAETIGLSISVISPDTGENRSRLESVLIRAASGASRRYGEYFDVEIKEQGKRSYDYDISFTAVMEGETPVLAMLFTPEKGGSPLNQSVMGDLDDNSPAYISELIFRMWAQTNPAGITSHAPEPVFLEEVPSLFLVESAIPDFSGYNTASAVAVRENGNLVLAMGALCYETDSNFNPLVQLAGDLYSPSSALFFFGTGVTPGGSVFLKPTNGRDIYKIVEGAPRTMKIRTGIDVTGPMAVLPNGTAVLYHTMSRKFVRIEGNRRSDLDIPLGPYTYVYAMAPGPEGNLWIHDNVEQRFKIFTDTGNFISSIMPVGTGDDVLTPMSMAVLDDGALILYSNSALYKFDSEGVLQWKKTGYHFREEESFPMSPVNLAVDQERGFIYMADYAANRILKFYDPALDRGGNDSVGETRRLLELNRRIDEDPYGEEPIRRKALYYRDREDWVLARYWLEELININPFDSEASSMLDEIEIRGLLRQASELEAETLKTARTIGPESARDLYSRTVRLYEKIISLDSSMGEASERMNRFKEAYNREAADIPGREEKPLTIAGLSVKGIFPALIHYYRENPVGTVRVKNDLDRDVSNIRALLNLKEYIDFPAESDPVPLLKPGEEITLDLKILLNEKAFNLREDLPLQFQVTLQYDLEGSARATGKTGNTTLYRRTALTWDNTAKLAAFIMPNESVVSTFSHRVLADSGKVPGLPPKMVKAARICDALGTYGIAYIEDPESPFSQQFEEEGVIDTVRYPRTTLQIRSGDCDDSTALLASMLESSGIATAIMTSPGHVFMAFDTEEPAGNRWMYENTGREILIEGGTIWIPLESTYLQDGFNASWAKASEIISRYSRNEIGFLTVAGQRSVFPPLPLGESSIMVVEPGNREIDPLNSETLAGLTASLYEENASKLKGEAAGASGRREHQLSNRLAVLHARFENWREAENIFQSLIKGETAYLSPYVNLGNLYYSRGEYGKALEIFQEALAINGNSLMVNLALAKTYYRLGDRAGTARYYRLVKNQSEPLSEEYAYLGESGSTTRAGADDEPPLLWMTEE